MIRIDIKKVEAAAAKQIAKERSDNLRDLLLQQMRAVEKARAILQTEETRLEVIKTRIAEGSI
jgi:hypothetical protein